MKHSTQYTKQNTTRRILFNVFVLSCVLCLVSCFSSCSKVIDINIPDSAQQVVVEGTIENNVPPIVILTKSQKFFGTIDLTDIGNYFVHGASIRVSGSDGTQTDLMELCLQNLNLPPNQQEILLNAFGFTSVDSSDIPNVCIYTVPDIANYFLTGTTAFMGKENTTYNLDIIAPPFSGSDSIHITSSTYIPTAIGMDSLSIREPDNAELRDSMVSIYANVTVPNTYGNFLRYKTKRNSEPFYNPALSGSVWDDKLFVGLQIALPIERAQAPGAKLDFKTAFAYWKGDTVTVKWSNIDSKTYDFFYTLENEGGNSMFSSPVKIKTNINNGLGVWAGYATKYYTIIIPR